MKKKQKIELYCSVCGKNLIRIPVSADRAMIPGYDTSYPLGTRYNKYTGMRQFGIRVICLKAKWWNYHTNYIDQGSLQDSDLPELIKLK